MPETEEKKYQPRNTKEELNAQARVYIAEALGDIDKLKGYLDVMARFPDYSAMNCAHIAMHRPQAVQLWDTDAIKEAGGYINRGEKGVPILAPVYVPGKDGEPGKRFTNVKYMFARDQQHGARLDRPKTYDQQTVLDAMRAVDTCRAPASREGLYIVGRHFGLNGYIEKLPELPSSDDLNTALETAVGYMNDVHAEVKPFVYALERKCAELVADKTVERNEKVAQMFARSAERAESQQQEQEAPQADAPTSEAAPKAQEQKAKPTSAKARMEAARQAAQQRSGQTPKREAAPKAQEQKAATAAR